VLSFHILAMAVVNQARFGRSSILGCLKKLGVECNYSVTAHKTLKEQKNGASLISQSVYQTLSFVSKILPKHAKLCARVSKLTVRGVPAAVKLHRRSELAERT